MKTGGAFSRRFYRLTRRCAALLFRILSILLLAFPSSAERLPIKTYAVGDGLAHNSVKQIFQDAKGFLWIATFEGLSRFDGYDFTNYDTNDGLGHIFINDVTADNYGRLWIATNGGGVSLLIDEPPEKPPKERKKFISFQIAEGGENNTANAVNRILFDAENRLWCATDDGIYRAANLEVADYAFERVASGTQPVIYNAALRDRRGRLWFGVSSNNGKNRVIQIAGEKTTEYEVRETDSAASLEIHTIIEDGDGRILAAGAKHIFEFVEPAEEAERGAWRKLPIKPPPPIQTIAPAPDGGLWIGAGGLMRVQQRRQTFYTTANGLGANTVFALFYDREGNLWIGTNGGGLGKLAGEGVVSYTVAQGLSAPDVYRIIEDRRGRIYALVGGCRLAEITEDSRIVPLSDSEELSRNSCSEQLLLQDTRGNWWFNSRQGVKFSTDTALNLRRGKFILDENKQPFIYSEIYEDATGDIWLANIPKGKLYRVEKGDPQNLSVAAENVQAEFIIRDKNSGTIWIASRAAIWRVRGGQVKEIEKIEGLPVIQPRSLFQDSRGRIWIGTRYHGAVVSEEPEADKPRFSHYRTAEGLSSDTVWEVAEDDDGRIYFGTGRGIDQLDTASGKFHHFTVDEGAISAAVFHLLKDSQGNIWAASINGITRINPRKTSQTEKSPPPIFISQIRVAGEDLPLAETGATEVPAVELTGNNVTIRFVGLSFQGENALRYEYKLGGGDTDWVAAGNQREVNFANLGAGDYRFEVRAVNAENVKSPQPAAFEFHILRPVYLRWWFLILASLFIAALIYLLYRNRLRRLLEIERTRTRIATDLHDDIGANLSKISLLSDIVNMQMNDGNAESQRMLTTIAEVSRSSVAAMRDIVWAINPQRDSVLEMTRKMRQYAEETFVPKDVTVIFDAPADGANLKLSMDTRRELFLIFKEAINNAARHSQCSQVKIVFSVAGGEIFLQISDDGCGFDTARDLEGNGLSNMKARAEKIGGRFEVESEQGSGTTIKVKI